MNHMKTSIDPEVIDSEAIYRRAYQFDMGLNGPMDKMQAMRLYEKAAQLGHPKAQNNLGAMYEAGEGIAVDYEKAIYWFERSAAKQNPSAMINLGEMLLSGKGVPVDYERARGLFEDAAAIGRSEIAYKYLSKIYLYGLGVERDRQKALDLMLDGMACARA